MQILGAEALWEKRKLYRLAVIVGCFVYIASVIVSSGGPRSSDSREGAVAQFFVSKMFEITQKTTFRGRSPLAVKS